jgi:hypothetical protein
VFFCLSPPTFLQSCGQYLVNSGVSRHDAYAVCQYFAGWDEFPTVLAQRICQVARDIDWMIGVGAFTVAALKGHAAANFYDLGQRALGAAATRFALRAGLVGIVPSTKAEARDHLGY